MTAEIPSRNLMGCQKDCLLMSVAGVLTLDEEDRLQVFCDRCELNR